MTAIKPIKGQSPARQPRISVVIWGLQGGAFTNIGTCLARGFAANGADAELIVIRPASFDHLIKYPDITVHSLRATKTSTAIPRLVSHLRWRRPDVLLSMPNIVNLPAIVATRLARCGTKVVISEQNNLSFDMDITHRSQPKMRAIPLLMTELYPFAHGLSAPSAGILVDPRFQRSIRRCQLPTAVIPNPFPESALASRDAAEGAPPHAWLTADRRIPVLLTIGRLVEQKGIDTLLHALHNLAARRVDARLLVLGVGPLRDELEHLRDQLGLRDRVDFLGYRQDAPRFMAACDAFVLASRWEGFGIVLAEAMACGKPIVATNAPGGPSEILHDRENALVVPVDDATKLADALETLLGNEELAGALREGALAHAQTYTSRAVAARYLDFFDQVLRS